MPSKRNRRLTPKERETQDELRGLVEKFHEQRERFVFLPADHPVSQWKRTIEAEASLPAPQAPVRLLLEDNRDYRRGFQWGLEQGLAAGKREGLALGREIGQEVIASILNLAEHYAVEAEELKRKLERLTPYAATGKRTGPTAGRAGGRETAEKRWKEQNVDGLRDEFQRAWDNRKSDKISWTTVCERVGARHVPKLSGKTVQRYVDDLRESSGT